MSHNHIPNYDGAHNKNGIPPNLIRNFNFYEVLEPTKVNKVKEDTLLIDLGESCQVRNEISASSQRPTISMQEKNDGFSMIDLYQNIYVTPELVSKPIENPVSNNQSTINIDYEEFLRKFDSKKLNSIQKSSSDKKDYRTHQAELEQTFDNLRYKEHQSMTPNGVCHNFDSSNSAEHEELIDELLDRNLGGLKISKAAEVAGEARVLKTPNLIKNTRYDANVLHKDNIKYVHNIGSTHQIMYVNDNGLLKEKNILQQASTTCEPVPMEMKSKFNDNLVSDFLKAMECKDIKLITTQDQSVNRASTHAGLQSSLPSSSRYDIPNLSSLALKNNDKLAEWKKTVNNANVNESKFDNDTFKLIKTTNDPEIMSAITVKAIVKDNKTFAKKHRITSDNEKLNYTKGPDLSEKRVVLPQILDRLSLEKKIYTVKQNFQRRLVLDAGSKQSGKGIEIPVTLEPTVLMEDCNKERLKAFRTRQTFHNFVNGALPP